MSFRNVLLLCFARQSRRLFSDMYSIYTNTETRKRQNKSNIIEKHYIPKMYISCKNLDIKTDRIFV